ncbi:MAG: adenylate/guanylate cyclase domain-containing protein [Planctomycetota bacterium]
MSPRRRFPLHLTITTLLVGLLTLTVGGVLVVALLIRGRSLEATARALQEEAARGFAQRLEARLRPAEGILRSTARALVRGDLARDDGARLAEGLAERIRYDDRFEWLGFRGVDGAAAGAVHRPGGDLWLIHGRPPAAGEEPHLVSEILHPDGSRSPGPVLRGEKARLAAVAWYEAGAGSEGPVWTKRYVAPVSGQPARACALGIREEGRLVGVVATGFTLEFIQAYLGGIHIAETGRVLLARVDDGEVAVAPSPEDRGRLGPVVKEAIGRLPGGIPGLKVGEASFTTVAYEGISYAVGIELQELTPTMRWINAAVVPTDELVGFLGRYLVYALVGIAVLLALSVFLASLLARRIATPLTKIADELARVGNFDLSPQPAPASLIREVAVVADSVDRMKASLRSFGRYVPTDLVRDLLSHGQEARLDGRLRPLTLFFSDVKGFTSVSEGMAPQVLVDALGAYLEVLTRGVQGWGGTIDKFMGDGVLAFFNAPRDDPDHVAHACRAALAVQQALAAKRPEWEAEGLPPFLTRIGLHTDEVVVGNIGTAERFSYTVLGDGVNLAARLESLNKAYGTWILASRDVRERVGDAFEWRRIDRTAVAGRTEGTDVYELLGESGAVDASLLEARDLYERALEAYGRQRFEEAVEGFEAVLARAPDDQAAAALLERARHYAGTPPPDDWNGVFVQTHK